MDQNQSQQSSPVPVSDDSLMPHQESHDQGSQIIPPAMIQETPTELRDVISISKSDLGVIVEPKSKKWPVVLIAVAALVVLFILYEYMVYRSLIGK